MKRPSPSTSVIQDGERKSYLIGFRQNTGLVVDKNTVYHISINKEQLYIQIVCNLETKELRVFRKRKTERVFSAVNFGNIHRQSVIDLNNDGMRWEGGLYNGKPFGYGHIYANRNSVAYEGFMVDGKKVCYGTDYYSNGVLEYSGCYWNDQRHGPGMLCDRKGNVLYSGDHICDLRDFQKGEVNDKNADDSNSINSLNKQIIIGDECLKSWTGNLIVSTFSQCETLFIGSSSLSSVQSLNVTSILFCCFFTNGSSSTVIYLYR